MITIEKIINFILKIAYAVSIPLKYIWNKVIVRLGDKVVDKIAEKIATIIAIATIAYIF